MPQSSDELRGIMDKWFRNGGINDAEPMAFLQSHGFELQKNWFWKLPVPDHTVSCYEWRCIVFLVEEWDMGTIADDNAKPSKCLCGKCSYGLIQSPTDPC